jgi:exodeoxyribonuclease V alpha subunit
MHYSPHRTFAHFFKEEKLAPYIFALSKKMQEGHVCLDLNQIPMNKEFWEEFEGRQIVHSEFPFNEELIGMDSEALKPFVLSDDKLYLNRNYFYETQIVEGLTQIVESEKGEFDERKGKLLQHKDFIEGLRSEDKNLPAFEVDEKPDWQLVAAIQGALNNLTLVTGGPGTGKTTTVAKILALINQMEKDLTIILTAPTGKAAMRMKESLLNTVNDERNENLQINDLVADLEAKTMHSLLGSIHQSPFFKHNQNNPLNYDVVVVDEASMIGVGLFAKLIQAMKPGARLIILGDAEQLAPVDAGSLFGDLCTGLKKNENQFKEKHLEFINNFLSKDRQLNDLYKLDQPNSFLDEHLVRLKKTYRYDQNSKMGQFTKAVIAGKVDELEGILSLEEESLVLDQDYDEKLFEQFVSKYKAYIEEPSIEEALINLNNCRVLCAVRQGDQGIYKINERIEGLLKSAFNGQKNTEGLFYFKPSDGFYHNQPIMVTQNTPAIGLKNGDVGIIREQEGRLKAFFPSTKDSNHDTTINSEKLKVVNPAIIPEWETVFAMTIHKSQGSEFNEVMVILPKQEENRLLTRELLYTGVTRAKEKATVQSSLGLVKKTANQGVDRGSGIQERIKN